MNAHSSNRLVASIVGTTIACRPAWAIDIVTVVPEPGTMALVPGGIGAAVLIGRKKRK